MARSSADLRAVPDGEVLHVLPNGIGIVRRRKHEPRPGLLGLPHEAMSRMTRKERGSKFLPGTTLTRIVEMTAEVLLENRAAPGSNTPYNKVFPVPIGVSKGRLVRALKVFMSLNGTLAHAVPVDESEL